MITDSLLDRTAPHVRAAQPAKWTRPKGVRIVLDRDDTDAVYAVRIYRSGVRRGANSLLGRSWRDAYWGETWWWVTYDPQTGEPYGKYTRDWPTTADGQTRAWQYGVERVAAEHDLLDPHTLPRGYALVREHCRRLAAERGVPRIPEHFSVDCTWHAIEMLASVQYGVDAADRASLDCGFGFSIYPCGLEVYTLDCLAPHSTGHGYTPDNRTSWAIYIAGSTLCLRARGQAEGEQAFYWVASADADPSDPTSVECVGTGTAGATIVLHRLREAGHTLGERDRTQREQREPASTATA